MFLVPLPFLIIYFDFIFFFLIVFVNVQVKPLCAYFQKCIVNQ